MIVNVGDDSSPFDERANQNKGREQVTLANQFTDGQGHVDTLGDNLAGCALQIRQAVSVLAGVSSDMRTDPKAKRNLLVKCEQGLPSKVRLVGRREYGGNVRRL